MLQKFHKYHGAGNDFVMIDNITQSRTKLSNTEIASICHRRFGVGADGLIVLEPSAHYDFEMVYYNSNGYEGTMCGNGGRCAVYFAYRTGIIEQETNFKASDGIHKAVVTAKNEVNLAMQNVKKPVETPYGLFIDSGSPHVICQVANIKTTNIYQAGSAIRNNSYFAPEGVNVNFFQIKQNTIYLRTYERGVEDETWACGTGSVATAIGAFETGLIYKEQNISIQTKGGMLEVSFNYKKNIYNNVWLKGPVQEVFTGYNPN